MFVEKRLRFFLKRFSGRSGRPFSLHKMHPSLAACGQKNIAQACLFRLSLCELGSHFLRRFISYVAYSMPCSIHIATHIMMMCDSSIRMNQNCNGMSTVIRTA